MSEYDDLAIFVDRSICEPFIRSIRFPRFKNLAASAELEFGFPITALVGPNGTNKSSILRALQACPNQYNIGDHWFDTKLDRIDPAGEQDPHRYIHTYRAPSGSLAQVIKARVGKTSRGADYFETSAPRRRDGMAPMPSESPREDTPLRNKTRWKPIEKHVVYLDFRSGLPAYDIFMSFKWSGKANDPSDKKRRVRDRSRHVSAALHELREEHNFYGKNRILEPAEVLNADELDCVRRILGRRYASVCLVKHEYFGVEGYTAALETEHREYSEAYAGSGEFAAIMLVRSIARAPERSLILLDEPETSLHPGAQSELMRFIAKECKAKKHQVVIATHAPAIVDGLPDHARKLLDINPRTGHVEVVAQSASSEEAFARVGAHFDRKTIIVEDDLAKEFVLRAARVKGQDFMDSINVTPMPGGADTLLRRVATVQAHLQSECLMVLDGDVRPKEPLLDPSKVPDADLQVELDKVNISEDSLVRNGGAGDAALQLAQARRVTYEWVAAHVRFLPSQVSPDALLLRLADKDSATEPAKPYWRDRTHRALGMLPGENVSARQILETQRRELAKLDDQEPALQSILGILEEGL